VRILILGGTRFLGPHLVEAALAKKHTVTLFNRGKSNPGLFPDLETLLGDRDGKLDALRDRKWDAVIDTSGYVPRIVRLSAELLAPNVRHYVFISTISVYADFNEIGITESSTVGTLEDPTVEQITGETYGPLKALCEQAAEAAMPGRTTSIRPGLICGPLDTSDRFTYWPVRVDRGGEVLAPGDPEAAVQFIDVRDLAEWTIRMVEDGHAGVYNAVGPKGLMTMEELLHGCKIVTGADARFTWVAESFLLEQGVQPWMEMPLWIPGREGAGLARVDCSKAISVGLAFRPAGVLIHDTLEWAKTRPADTRWRAGLDAAKERKVLDAWHAKIDAKDDGE